MVVLDIMSSLVHRASISSGGYREVAMVLAETPSETVRGPQNLFTIRVGNKISKSY